MLTAKSDERDRIAGLELGVDDYVTKPFSPRELVLRVHAILRRGRHPQGEKPPVSYGRGELLMDEGRRPVVARGAPVELTPTEWGILTTLARVPGRGLFACVRTDQPCSGLRVRWLRADREVAHQEPAAQGGSR